MKPFDVTRFLGLLMQLVSAGGAFVVLDNPTERLGQSILMSILMQLMGGGFIAWFISDQLRWVRGFAGAVFGLSGLSIAMMSDGSAALLITGIVMIMAGGMFALYDKTLPESEDTL
jgi:hypothetical protein